VASADSGLARTPTAAAAKVMRTCLRIAMVKERTELMTAERVIDKINNW
jgi:hypothetical protein